MRVFAPALDGRASALYDDPRRTAPRAAAPSAQGRRRAIRSSPAAFGRIGRRRSRSLVDDAAAEHRSARARRPLGAARPRPQVPRARPSATRYRLLRWGPMAVADLVAEWFETDLLRAAVAARGIFGRDAGPGPRGRSARPAPARAALDGTPAGAIPCAAAWARSRRRSADGRAGGGARDPHRAPRSSGSSSRDGRVTGVVLASGEEIPARVVVSSADPQAHLLTTASIRADLAPELRARKMRNYRCRRHRRQGQPRAVARCRASAARRRLRRRALAAAFTSGPEIDYLERAFDAAKYGEFSPQPWLDITIPSLTDPALAPPARTSCRSTSSTRRTSCATGDWDARREELGDAVARDARRATHPISRADRRRDRCSRRSTSKSALRRSRGGHIFTASTRSISSSPCARSSAGRSYRTPIAACTSAAPDSSGRRRDRPARSQREPREIRKDLPGLTAALAFTRFRNPPGLNVIRNFSREASTANSGAPARNSWTASCGPGPKSGRTGCPLTLVSSTIR